MRLDCEGMSIEMGRDTTFLDEDGAGAWRGFSHRLNIYTHMRYITVS